MRAVFKIILEPEGKRYNNTIDTQNGELILNTNVSIDDFKFTNRIGVVKSLPLFDVPYNVGDRIVVHTNVFRKFYDVNGKLKNGSSYLDENSFACSPDQVFAYNDGSGWKSVGYRCFVTPTINDQDIRTHLEKNKKCFGTLSIGNDILSQQGIEEGDSVGFLYGGEFVFDIDGEIMYNMNCLDICAHYEV